MPKKTWKRTTLVLDLKKKGIRGEGVRHLSSMANFRNPVDITVMFFREEKWTVYRMNSIVHSTISETIFPFHRDKMNKYGKRNIEAKVVSFSKRNIFCLSIFTGINFLFCLSRFLQTANWSNRDDWDNLERISFFFFSLFSLSYLFLWTHLPLKRMTTEGWKVKKVSRSNIRPNNYL